jgi:polysaccharide biosynthesis PFTS motif protein
MFPEIIKEHFIRSVPTEALAKDYLFHNSGNTYVPLWAYNVEARGAKIICYFYSTYEQLKAPEGYQSQKFELGAQTWPTFMVWNKFQMNNLKLQYIHKPEFIITGPIFFKRSLADMPKINGRKIAVFDNQPYRLFYFSNISTLAEYKAYSSKLYEKYFLDIKQVLSFYGWTMVLKQKKRMPNKMPKWYRKLIDELSQSKDVIVIDPGIAAEEVIAACDATISFPLTSTGVIADNMNKKSIFYDPTGWVQKDDKGAHGLPVLIGRDELFSWAHKLDVHLSRYSCSN